MQPNLSLIHNSAEVVEKVDPSAGSAGAPPPDKSGPGPVKPKPRRALPTARLTLKKQLDLLRGYAVASEFGAKAAHYAKAAELADMHPNTSTLCSTFFYDTGLLGRADGGVMPSSDVIAFARAYEWDQEAAAAKLRPTLRRSWFANVLTMHLKMRPLAEQDALRVLAEEVHASPEHRPQLKLCLDYLEIGRVVARTGDLIRLVEPEADDEQRPAPAPVVAASALPAEAPAVPMQPRGPAGEPVGHSAGRSDGGGTVPPSPHGAEFGIRFQCSVNITMSDLARLTPEQISELFAGLAKVVAIQSATPG